MLIAVGVASWYMISESHIKPKYNPDSAFYIYLNNQSTTYNGAAQLPKSTNDNVSFDKDTISFICYKKNSEGKFVEYEHDAPIDAGDYLLRYSDSDDESNGGYAGSDVLFKINKATLTLESISVNYNQFTGKNYFSSKMDTTQIEFISSFSLNMKQDDDTFENVYITGDVQLTTNQLSVGTFDYDYIFTPNSNYSNNINEYTSSISITTFAEVQFIDDTLNGNSLIKTEYVEKGTKVSTFTPSPSDSYISEIVEENKFADWLDADNNVFDFNSTIESNTVLTASWNYKTHSILLYNLNADNSTIPEEITFRINELPINIGYPNLETKYFKRWNLGANNLDKGPANIDITLSNYLSYSGQSYNAYFYDIILIDTIEIDYSDSNRTFSNLKSDVLASASIKLADNTISDDTFRSCIDFEYMHNGYYYYGNLSAITDGYKDFLKTSTNIAGSTYITSFVIKYTNPETGEVQYLEENEKYIGVIKYKTALIGTTLYTIEDAISTANSSTTATTISLQGNATSSTSYVETAFSKYNFAQYLNDYSDSYSLNNCTLIVPYDSSNSSTSETKINNRVYSCLTVPDSITVNVASSSKILVCGVVSHDSILTNVNERGVLINDGHLIFNSGSTLEAKGFVKGNGLIELKSGATAIDCMTTFDWPGGTAASNLISNVFPINTWSLHNISCLTRIHSGSSYRAYMLVTVSIVGTKTADVVIVGTTDKCLFKISSGWIDKSASPAASWKTTDASYNALNTITGDNQLRGQKDILEIYGSCQDATFSINIYVSIESSTTKACPIPFVDLYVKSGSTLSLTKNDYLFLPGSKLVVEENASLSIGTDVDVSFETYQRYLDSIIATGNKRFSLYCVDSSSDAKMYTGGNITINGGNIGGLIEPLSENSTITFSKAHSTSFSSLFQDTNTDYIRYYNVKNLPAYGNINGTNRSFVAGTYTSTRDSNNNLIWQGSESGYTTSLAGKLEVEKPSSGCITKDTLITLADGTKKMVKDLLPTDLLLVFNHETGKYEAAPIIFNDVEPEDIYRIVNLKFSDGTIVKVVYEHGFFDTTLNKYVYIREDNMNEFIGHKFYQGNYDGTIYTSNEVTLVDAYVTEELTTVYSPVTVYHLNYFTEDMLSMPAGIPGLFNIFEYGDNLTFDKEQMEADIDKYGLYTYDDFKDYISYEVYSMFPAPYLKVAVGKGLTTYEEIIEMIYLYLEKHDLMK